jgi:ATP-binding cassette, subfamily B, multidrug efflux pump
MSQYYQEEELQHKNINLRMLNRLRLYILKYRAVFARVMVLNVLATLPGILEPHIIKIGIDKYIFAGNFRGVFYISALFLLIRLSGWLVTVANHKSTIMLGQQVLNDIRMQVFSHVQDLSMEYFDKTPNGRIIARADTDIWSMEHVMTWGTGILLNSFLTLLGALYFMTRYSPKLCLMVSAVIIILAVATNIFQKEGTKAYRKTRETSARITTELCENISGIKVIQAFVREKLNYGRFSDLTHSHMLNAVNSSKVWATYFPVVGFSSALGISIIILVGGNMVYHGQMKIGELSAYIMYLGMFFWPIFMMGELYNSLLETGTAAERIFQLLDTKPKVTDPPGSKDVTINGGVVFENVCFGYTDKRQVLRDINFRVEPGQKVAFVGHTGAGKTTVTNLIARFYEPQAGRISIDGNDLKYIRMHSLRRQMGIVPQDSFLFSGTVMDNLKYGNRDISDEDVIRGAKETSLHPFVEKLGNGYMTEVKERGAGLSEGERQLICITRAFLADPRILILDEATSAVDTHTETVIQKALDKLLVGRTCFIIAQRLSTIRKADNIYCIRDGELVEQGKHEELLRMNGYYSRMYHEFISRPEA